jgi:thiosulfate/3-mercaptopyruvate sulfurtransferase
MTGSSMLRTSSLRRLAAAVAVSLAGIAGASGEPLKGLIDPAGLKARLGQPGLVIVDIRSGETRQQGAAAFAAGHIPGSVHADYAHASWRLPRDKVSVYLPEPAQFEALAGDLGIANESDVVIVHEGTDATGFGAAARVYWSFKAMGHTSIAVLDGGYRGWTQDRANPVATGAPRPQAALYEAKPDPAFRASIDDVVAAQRGGKVTLVDSRPESYFSGLEKHRGVQSFGHIAGAVNVPHSRAIGPDFRVKDRKALEAAFASVGTGPAIAYCNTGHWAATDWFILSEVLGRTDVKMYDGSMLEFSAEGKGQIANPRAGSGS